MAYCSGKAIVLLVVVLQCLAALVYSSSLCTTSVRLESYDYVAVDQKCKDAPTEAHRSICLQMESWKMEGQRLEERSELGNEANTFKMSAEDEQREKALQCYDWGCVCVAIGGTVGYMNGESVCIKGEQNLPLKRVVRKEYRMLSDDERNRFHKAVQTLKAQGHWDVMALLHSCVENARGAHGGAAFPAWHREFLKRFDISLKLVDWTVSTPFWDVSLDEPLPQPKDSLVWSEAFMGEANADGKVFNGPFKNWPCTDGRPTIERSDKVTVKFLLFSQKRLQDIYKIPTYRGLASTICADPVDWFSYEWQHALVHFWVGGHMSAVRKSPNDPAFYLLHGFVDYIWEKWRHIQQKTMQRMTTEYSNRTCSQYHEKDAPMHPFGPPMKNFQGLSELYTQNMYEYDPSPNRCDDLGGCQSPYLFCDKRTEQCVSKVKPGGECQGFEDMDICYEGICVNKRCKKM